MRTLRTTSHSKTVAKMLICILSLYELSYYGNQYLYGHLILNLVLNLVRFYSRTLSTLSAPKESFARIFDQYPGLMMGADCQLPQFPQ